MDSAVEDKGQTKSVDDAVAEAHEFLSPVFPRGIVSKIQPAS
jgi:hypothetical protein